MTELEFEERLGSSVKVGGQCVPGQCNSLCSGERWAGTQTTLGAVDQIHNFGLYSESNGEPQQGFKMGGGGLGRSACWKDVCGCRVKDAVKGGQLEAIPARRLLQLAR